MKPVQDSNSLAWFSHVAPTLKLALPVMFARVGILTIAIVDTIMASRHGHESLAWYGMGSSILIPLLLIGIGFLVSVVVITAQQDGAGQRQACGRVWYTGLGYAFFLGIAMFLLCLLGERFLHLTGQTPEMSLQAGAVLKQFGWGIPAALMFTASIFFLEALHRPLPGMLIMAAANLLNVLFNWLFIFGHWGMPEMGAAGAAFATSLVRWFMFFSALAYILFGLDGKTYGLLGAAGAAVPGLKRRFRRNGYPMALGQGLESSGFSVLTLFAGWVGTEAVAAWSIVFNLMALIFMFAMGFAIAGGIRVGNALGRGDLTDIYRAGWVAVGLNILFISLIAALIFFFRTGIVQLFTSDAATASLTVTTLMIAAQMSMVPDCTQAVLLGVLRGVSDFWVATGLQAFAFWFIMVPVGYYLCVMQQGNAPGLSAAVAIGAFTGCLLLGARFQWLYGGKT